MLSRLARVLLAVDSFAQEKPLFRGMIHDITSTYGSKCEQARVVLQVSPGNYVHWEFTAVPRGADYKTEVKFKIDPRFSHGGKVLTHISERLALLGPFDSHVRVALASSEKV